MPLEVSMTRWKYFTSFSSKLTKDSFDVRANRIKRPFGSISGLKVVNTSCGAADCSEKNRLDAEIIGCFLQNRVTNGSGALHSGLYSKSFDRKARPFTADSKAGSPNPVISTLCMLYSGFDGNLCKANTELSLNLGHSF